MGVSDDEEDNVAEEEDGDNDSLSEGESSNDSDDDDEEEDEDSAPDQTLMFMIQSMAKLAESKENRQKNKLIAQSRAQDCDMVKQGLQTWFSHVEAEKAERVAQLNQEMEDEQARLLSLHDDLIAHAAAWSEAVAVHQAEIAERSEAFEEAKSKIAEMDDNATKEDASLRKKMRTKAKAAAEEFKQAKKKGASKKEKGRKAAAQAIQMQFN